VLEDQFILTLKRRKGRTMSEDNPQIPEEDARIRIFQPRPMSEILELLQLMEYLRSGDLIIVSGAPATPVDFILKIKEQIAPKMDKVRAEMDIEKVHEDVLTRMKERERRNAARSPMVPKKKLDGRHRELDNNRIRY
jgi:hypothetical protein